MADFYTYRNEFSRRRRKRRLVLVLLVILALLCAAAGWYWQPFSAIPDRKSVV